MSDHDLLVLWERGADRSAPECALALLATASATDDWDALVALPVGERDARLLDLRARLFGDRLTARVNCSSCDGDIELVTRASSLRAAGPPFSAHEEHVLVGGVTLLVRAPTAHDLVLAARCDDIDTARRMLFACCVTLADGTPAGVTALPDDARATVLAALDRVAGPAALQLRVTCSLCGAESDIEFDIASYLWREVSAEARRLAEEVVELARGLGWSEQEILALSPARRRLYLELVRS